MQSLETKVNKTLELSSSKQKAQIKGAKHMEEINESVKFINEKCKEMEADRKEEQSFEIKNEVKTLDEKVELMDRSLNSREHYSRRNCLLIHGVKDNRKEHTDEVVIEMFEKEMQEKVSVNEIDRSHQLGKEITRRRLQSIIVKFVGYNVRNAIFKI